MTTTLATETFTGADGAAWPSQWSVATDYTGGSSSIQSDTGALTSPSGGTYLTAGRVLSGVAPRGDDTDITFTFTTPSGSAGAEMYVAATLNSAGGQLISPDALMLLVAFESGTGSYIALFQGSTQIGSSVAKSAFTGGQSYGVRFRRASAQVWGRVWPTSGAEPTTWDFQIPLASLTTPAPTDGVPGLMMQNGADGVARTANFDNVVVTAPYVPPFIQTWDGGTGAANGTALSAATTNGPGNTAITSTAQNAGASEKFTNAWVHSGTLAMANNYAVTTAGYVNMPFTAPVGARFGVREYFSFPAASAGIAKRLWEYRATSSALLANVTISSTNVLEFIDTAGTLTTVPNGTIPHDGSTIRIEAAVTIGATISTGSFRLLAFVGESTTPFADSGEVTGANLGTTALGNFRLGYSGQVTAAFSYYRDDVAADNTLPVGSQYIVGPVDNGPLNMAPPLVTTGAAALNVGLDSTSSFIADATTGAAGVDINLAASAQLVVTDSGAAGVDINVVASAELVVGTTGAGLALNVGLVGVGTPPDVGGTITLHTELDSVSAVALIGPSGLNVSLTGTAFTVPGFPAGLVQLHSRLSSTELSYATPGTLSPFVITVYDRTFARLQTLGDPVYATFVPRWPAIGSAEIQLKVTDPANEWLQTPGARITATYRGEHLFSGPVVAYQGSMVADELVIYQFTDDYTHVADTLAWPSPTADLVATSTSDLAQGTNTYGYWVWGSPIAETAIKDIVSANFTRLSRGITIGPDLGRGGDQTASLGTTVRFDTLDSVVQPIAVAAGLQPYVRQVGGGLVFDVRPVTTWPQTLTFEGGVLSAGTYSIQSPATTRVIIGGPGQDVNRAFYGEADTSTESSWGRKIETFKDSTSGATLIWPSTYTTAQQIPRTYAVNPDITTAEQTAFTNALANAAQLALNAGVETAGTNITLSESTGFHYGGANGFHVGDVVTVSAGGVSINDTITECTLAWSAGTPGFTVSPAVGVRSGDPDIQLLAAVQLIATRLRQQATGR